MTTNTDGYIGEFEGAGERKKNGLWFKGTHFSLGQDKTSHHMGASQMAQLPMARGEGEKTKPLNDANKMRATHFVLGDNKNTGVTTNNATYQNPPDDFRRAAMHDPALRQSHFTTGDHENNYNTTHRVFYQEKKANLTPSEL